ncbi:hypothetical protein [Cellulomonas sp. NS3]|uniref:hypothetical protein n=1 Tax=Cellulomonas sp. NS3 TaxID=2973977 RepID=UPI0021611A22|nr:hypothetical protein [Cellulomonas sp. NS3]
MAERRLPVLPRVGFALLTVVLSLVLAVFVLLFFIVPDDERWNAGLPAVATLIGLLRTRGLRRTWLDQHHTAPSGAQGTATTVGASSLRPAPHSTGDDPPPV